MRRKATRILVFVVAISQTVGFSSEAQEVPTKLKWAIFFKVLGYDHNLQERCKEGVRIGVVSGAPDTLQAQEDLANIKKSSGNTIRKLKIFGFQVFVENTDKLIPKLRQHKINVIYLATNTGEFVPKVLDFAKNNKVLVLASTEQLVKQGAAVAIVRRGDKPKILMNVNSARSQGAEFDFRLIRLAEVINPTARKP